MPHKPREFFTWLVTPHVELLDLQVLRILIKRLRVKRAGNDHPELVSSLRLLLRRFLQLDTSIVARVVVCLCVIELRDFDNNLSQLIRFSFKIKATIINNRFTHTRIYCAICKRSSLL